MWGWRSSRTVTLAAAIAAFVVCCVLPIAYMIAVSVGGTFSPYASLLLDSRQRALLFNTVVLGLGTAFTTALVGVPLGVALARIALPVKAGLRIVLAVPVVLPSYVVGLAWIYLGGSTSFLSDATGRTVPSTWIYSIPGAIVILTLVLYPLSMLATEAAVRRIEPRLEEAALIVAGPRRVLWRITLPLVVPTIVAAALVIFVLAVSDFGVPALLRVRVFTTEIFTAFAALYDFARATVLALPVLVVAAIVAALTVRLAGDRLVATRRGLIAGDSRTFDAWRGAAATVSGVVVALAVVLPLAVLVHEASGVQSWFGVVAGARDAIRNSLALAALGATLVTGLAVWLGYARARASRRLGMAADVLFAVLFAVPSTIVGVGLIGLWNRAGMLGAVYGTHAMFVLVYLARFVPVAALILAANVRRVPVSHEEAAAVSGAGWSRTMVHVVLPQMKLGLLTAWVIVFVLAFGELGASVLVTPPGESTLPVRIYTLIANAPPAQVAALALMQAAVVSVPLALLGLGVAMQRRR